MINLKNGDAFTLPEMPSPCDIDCLVKKLDAYVIAGEAAIDEIKLQIQDAISSKDKTNAEKSKIVEQLNQFLYIMIKRLDYIRELRYLYLMSLWPNKKSGF